MSFTQKENCRSAKMIRNKPESENQNTIFSGCGDESSVSSADSDLKGSPATESSVKSSLFITKPLEQTRIKHFVKLQLLQELQLRYMKMTAIMLKNQITSDNDKVGLSNHFETGIKKSTMAADVTDIPNTLTITETMESTDIGKDLITSETSVAENEIGAETLEEQCMTETMDNNREEKQSVRQLLPELNKEESSCHNQQDFNNNDEDLPDTYCKTRIDSDTPDQCCRETPTETDCAEYKTIAPSTLRMQSCEASKMQDIEMEEHIQDDEEELQQHILEEERIKQYFSLQGEIKELQQNLQEKEDNIQWLRKCQRYKECQERNQHQDTSQTEIYQMQMHQHQIREHNLQNQQMVPVRQQFQPHQEQPQYTCAPLYQKYQTDILPFQEQQKRSQKQGNRQQFVMTQHQQLQSNVQGNRQKISMHQQQQVANEEQLLMQHVPQVQQFSSEPQILQQIQMQHEPQGQLLPQNQAWQFQTVQPVVQHQIRSELPQPHVAPQEINPFISSNQTDVHSGIDSTVFFNENVPLQKQPIVQHQQGTLPTPIGRQPFQHSDIPTNMARCRTCLDLHPNSSCIYQCSLQPSYFQHQTPEPGLYESMQPQQINQQLHGQQTLRLSSAVQPHGQQTLGPPSVVQPHGQQTFASPSAIQPHGQQTLGPPSAIHLYGQQTLGPPSAVQTHDQQTLGPPSALGMPSAIQPYGQQTLGPPSAVQPHGQQTLRSSGIQPHGQQTFGQSGIQPHGQQTLGPPSAIQPVNNTLQSHLHQNFSFIERPQDLIESHRQLPFEQYMQQHSGLTAISGPSMQRHQLNREQYLTNVDHPLHPPLHDNPQFWYNQHVVSVSDSQNRVQDHWQPQMPRMFQPEHQKQKSRSKIYPQGQNIQECIPCPSASILPPTMPHQIKAQETKAIPEKSKLKGIVADLKTIVNNLKESFKEKLLKHDSPALKHDSPALESEENVDEPNLSHQLTVILKSEPEQSKEISAAKTKVPSHTSRLRGILQNPLSEQMKNDLSIEYVPDGSHLAQRKKKKKKKKSKRKEHCENNYCEKPTPSKPQDIQVKRASAGEDKAQLDKDTSYNTESNDLEALTTELLDHATQSSLQDDLCFEESSQIAENHDFVASSTLSKNTTDKGAEKQARAVTLGIVPKKTNLETPVTGTLWIVGDDILVGSKVHDCLITGIDQVVWLVTKDLTLINLARHINQWLLLHPRPTHLLLHIGINDMARSNLKTHCHNIDAAILFLREQFPETTVFWSEIISKLGALVLDKKQVQLNKYAMAKIDAQSNMFIIEHDNVDYNGLFKRDKLMQLTDLGLQKLLKTIQFTLKLVCGKANAKSATEELPLRQSASSAEIKENNANTGDEKNANNVNEGSLLHQSPTTETNENNAKTNKPLINSVKQPSDIEETATIPELVNQPNKSVKWPSDIEETTMSEPVKQPNESSIMSAKQRSDIIETTAMSELVNQPNISLILSAKQPNDIEETTAMPKPVKQLNKSLIVSVERPGDIEATTMSEPVKQPDKSLINSVKQPSDIEETTAMPEPLEQPNKSLIISVERPSDIDESTAKTEPVKQPNKSLIISVERPRDNKATTAMPEPDGEIGQKENKTMKAYDKQVEKIQQYSASNNESVMAFIMQPKDSKQNGSKTRNNKSVLTKPNTEKEIEDQLDGFNIRHEINEKREGINRPTYAPAMQHEWIKANDEKATTLISPTKRSTRPMIDFNSELFKKLQELLATYYSMFQKEEHHLLNKPESYAKPRSSPGKSKSAISKTKRKSASGEQTFSTQVRPKLTSNKSNLAKQTKRKSSSSKQKLVKSNTKRKSSPNYPNVTTQIKRKSSPSNPNLLRSKTKQKLSPNKPNKAAHTKGKSSHNIPNMATHTKRKSSHYKPNLPTQTKRKSSPSEPNLVKSKTKRKSSPNNPNLTRQAKRKSSPNKLNVATHTKRKSSPSKPNLSTQTKRVKSKTKNMSSRSSPSLVSSKIKLKSSSKQHLDKSETKSKSFPNPNSILPSADWQDCGSTDTIRLASLPCLPETDESVVNCDGISRTSDTKVNRLWIIGDELLNGAERRATLTKTNTFGLSKETTDVSWYCSHGETLAGFVSNNFQNMLQKSEPPTVIIIQLGTNDALLYDDEDNFKNVDEALEMFKDLVPDCVILWSEIPKLCYSGLKTCLLIDVLTRRNFNNKVVQSLHRMPNLFVIGHEYDYHVYDKTSKHLSVMGLDNLLAAYRATIQRLLQNGKICIPHANYGKEMDDKTRVSMVRPTPRSSASAPTILVQAASTSTTITPVKDSYMSKLLVPTKTKHPEYGCKARPNIMPRPIPTRSCEHTGQKRSIMPHHRPCTTQPPPGSGGKKLSNISDSKSSRSSHESKKHSCRQTYGLIPESSSGHSNDMKNKQDRCEVDMLKNLLTTQSHSEESRNYHGKNVAKRCGSELTDGQNEQQIDANLEQMRDSKSKEKVINDDARNRKYDSNSAVKKNQISSIDGNKHVQEGSVQAHHVRKGMTTSERLKSKLVEELGNGYALSVKRKAEAVQSECVNLIKRKCQYRDGISSSNSNEDERYDVGRDKEIVMLESHGTTCEENNSYCHEKPLIDVVKKESGEVVVISVNRNASSSARQRKHEEDVVLEDYESMCGDEDVQIIQCCKKLFMNKVKVKQENEETVESPSTNCQEKPSTNCQEKPSTNCQEKTSTNCQEKTSTNCQEKPESLVCEENNINCHEIPLIDVVEKESGEVAVISVNRNASSSAQQRKHEEDVVLEDYESMCGDEDVQIIQCKKLSMNKVGVKQEKEETVTCLSANCQEKPKSLVLLEDYDSMFEDEMSADRASLKRKCTECEDYTFVDVKKAKLDVEHATEVMKDVTKEIGLECDTKENGNELEEVKEKINDNNIRTMENQTEGYENDQGKDGSDESESHTCVACSNERKVSSTYGASLFGACKQEQDMEDSTQVPEGDLNENILKITNVESLASVDRTQALDHVDNINTFEMKIKNEENGQGMDNSDVTGNNTCAACTYERKESSTYCASSYGACKQEQDIVNNTQVTEGFSNETILKISNVESLASVYAASERINANENNLMSASESANCFAMYGESMEHESKENKIVVKVETVEECSKQSCAACRQEAISRKDNNRSTNLKKIFSSEYPNRDIGQKIKVESDTNRMDNSEELIHSNEHGTHCGPKEDTSEFTSDRPHCNPCSKQSREYTGKKLSNPRNSKSQRSADDSKDQSSRHSHRLITESGFCHTDCMDNVDDLIHDKESQENVINKKDSGMEHEGAFCGRKEEDIYEYTSDSSSCYGWKNDRSNNGGDTIVQETQSEVVIVDGCKSPSGFHERSKQIRLRENELEAKYQHIWMVGDFIMEKAYTRAKEQGNGHLGFTSVEWHISPNAGLKQTYIKRRLKHITGSSPTFIVIHLGSQNLMELSIKNFGEKVDRIIQDIRNSLPYCHIVWSSMLRHCLCNLRVSIKQIDSIRLQANKEAEERLKSYELVHHISYDHVFRRSGRTFYEMDGLSLSQKGIDMFLRILGSALGEFFRNPDKVYYPVV